MTLPGETPSVAAMPSAAACAQAAAWIARLHGESRTARVEAGFQRWLASSPEHRAAFEMANDIWVRAEQLPKPPMPAFVRWPRAGLIVTLPRALAFAVVVAVGVAVLLFSHAPDISTAVGEQRNLSLEDGTRVLLNTASRISVHYDRRARRVDLERGEAFFEVAKRPDWPFVVVVDGRQVVAHGTAFMVRRSPGRVTVTLVEGKVVVSPVRVPARKVPIPPGRSPGHALAYAGSSGITLAPGQRLTFVGDQSPTLDTLGTRALERITAWQRGQVILDHTPLADAAAEMNRYSNVKLRIEEPAAGRAEVTGIFRVGDSESFAQAVAETYQLQIADRDGEIVLSGLPRESRGKAYKR